MICSEKWKTIDGYPEKVEVSTFGRIKSNGKLLSGERCTNGYIRIKVSDCGIIYRELLHRLVAKAFIPNTDDKPCVNHINGIKTDNRVENLEWCTYGENNKHAYGANLRCAKGENNGCHKLTETQVKEIRKLYEKGKHNGNNSGVLAEIYGVDPKTILDVVNKKLWGWL